MIASLKALWDIVWSFVSGVLKAVRDFVRSRMVPGKRKEFLFSLALLCMVGLSGFLLLRSFDDRETIRVVTVERDTASITLADTKKKLTDAEFDLKSWKSKYEQLSSANANAIADATARQKAAQNEMVGVLTELHRLRDQSRKSGAAFMRNYENRSEVCRVTQTALDVNCREFGKLE